MQFEEQNKVRNRKQNEVSITRGQFAIVEQLLLKFEREVARFLTIKFQTKANSNYKSNIYGVGGNQTSNLSCDECMTENSKLYWVGHHRVTAPAW